MGPLTVSGDLDVRGRIYDGIGPDIDILDNLSVSEDLTVWGSDIFVGDDDAVDDIINFAGTEQFLWNESDNEFRLSDDLYIPATLTATEGAVIGDDTGDIFAVTSSGLNVVQDGALWDTDSAVEVRDDLSVSGSLTIGKTIRVGNVDGAVVFNAIDDDGIITASGLMDATNDLYVEGDVEVGGDLNIIFNI